MSGTHQSKPAPWLATLQSPLLPQVCDLLILSGQNVLRLPAVLVAAVSPYLAGLLADHIGHENIHLIIPAYCHHSLSALYHLITMGGTFTLSPKHKIELIDIFKLLGFGWIRRKRPDKPVVEDSDKVEEEVSTTCRDKKQEHRIPPVEAVSDESVFSHKEFEVQNNDIKKAAEDKQLTNAEVVTGQPSDPFSCQLLQDNQQDSTANSPVREVNISQPVVEKDDQYVSQAEQPATQDDQYVCNLGQLAMFDDQLGQLAIVENQHVGQPEQPANHQDDEPDESVNKSSQVMTDEHPRARLRTCQANQELPVKNCSGSVTATATRKSIRVRTWQSSTKLGRMLINPSPSIKKRGAKSLASAYFNNNHKNVSSQPGKMRKPCNRSAGPQTGGVAKDQYNIRKRSRSKTVVGHHGKVISGKCVKKKDPFSIVARNMYDSSPQSSFPQPSVQFPPTSPSARDTDVNSADNAGHSVSISIGGKTHGKKVSTKTGLSSKGKISIVKNNNSIPKKYKLDDLLGCNLQNSSPPSLKSTRQQSPNLLLCPECSKTGVEFTCHNQAGLEHHLTKTHFMEKICTQYPGTTCYLCKSPSKLATNNLLAIHLGTAHSLCYSYILEPFSCGICGKVVESIGKFKSHLMLHYRAKLKADFDGVLQCPYCPHVVSTKASVVHRHLGLHHSLVFKYYDLGLNKPAEVKSDSMPVPLLAGVSAAEEDVKLIAVVQSRNQPVPSNYQQTTAYSSTDMVELEHSVKDSEVEEKGVVPEVIFLE